MGIVVLAISGLTVSAFEFLRIETGESPIARDKSAANGTGAGRITLQHDFGIIPPIEKQHHVFAVTNDTGFEWSLKRIGSSCRCTAAAASSTTIAPGCTETFTVEYTPGQRSGDEARTVTIEFEEQEAPIVYLAITAKVRRPLSVFPEQLSLAISGQGSQAVGYLEVENHSHSNWAGLTVRSHDKTDWINTVVHELTGAPRQPRDVRQRWRLAVTANGRMLRPGRYTCPLEIRANDSDAHTHTVTVDLQVASAVQAIPSQFFLGKVKRGASVSRKVTLAFAPNLVPHDTSSVKVNDDPSVGLECAWGKRTGRFWELEATFRSSANDPGSLFEVPVVITFQGQQLPTLTIPVRALIE